MATKLTIPRIGIVGCGYWGTNLIRNFAELGALAAVSDSSLERQNAAANLYDVPGRPISDILADESIDGLVIAVPAAQHARLALQTLSSGKHVFVEKPLALSLTDAEALVEASERQHKVCMVGHLLRYHPAYIALQRIVAQGGLGRLRYIYSNRLNLGKIRREENVFWSFAPHDISMILGLVPSPVKSVTTVGYSYLQKQIADVTTTHLAFETGVNAHIFVSWLHPFKEQKLVVVGETAMAVFDDGEPWTTKLLVYPHKIQWQNGLPEPSRAESVAEPLKPLEPLRQECQHFLDCISQGRTPVTDAKEGLAVLRILHSAECQLRQPQKIESSPLSDRTYYAHESALIEDDVQIGNGTKIWRFSHIHRGSSIGENCTIGQNVAVGPDVTIGSGCKIQNSVSVYKGVTLREDVFCGPSCVFTNVSTPRANVDRKSDFLPTEVGRGATIGANATIVCGHELGEYCFVAAGAVVTRHVRPFELVAGNPARHIGWVSHAGERLGPDLVCRRTGRRYSIVNDILIEASKNHPYQD